ncbi:hypothetical protein MMC21_008061 [Puttea exsequens]|nr:hypothetical protein [Puttea exsequens]
MAIRASLTGVFRGHGHRKDSPIDYDLATDPHAVRPDWIREILRSGGPKKVASYHDLFMPKIMEVSVELDPINAFGSVELGFFELDSISAAGVLTKQARPMTMQDRDLSFAGHDGSWQATAYMDNMDDEEQRVQEVLCALVGYRSGSLVFLLLDPPDPGAKSHVRTGIALLKKQSAWDLLDHLPRCTIIIL